MSSALNSIAQLAGAEKVQAAGKGKGQFRNVTWETFPWTDLKPGHTRWLIDLMNQRGYAPTSKNKMLNALSGVYRQLHYMGYWSAAELEQAQKFDWFRLPNRPPPPNKQPITTQEFSRMLAAARADHSDTHRLRNDAILWLLWAYGMRRAELVAIPNGRGLSGLTLDKYNHRERVIEVTLKRNTRFVPVEGKALAALEAWLDVRGRRSGAIFVRIDKSGDVLLDEPICDDTIYNVVKWRARKATPPVSDVNPHRFRHSVVTTLHSLGVEAGLLARLVGHSGISTILTYINPTEHEIRLAVRRMPMPTHGGRDSPGSEDPAHAVSNSGPGATDRGSNG